MGTALLALPEEVLLSKRTFGVSSDFEHFVTGDVFTSLAADSGAGVTAEDEVGGILKLVTGATLNNEAAIFTTKKIYKFADGKPLRFFNRQQYAEANTDDAAVYCGLSSAFAANLLADSTGVPAANMSAVGFCKGNGDTLWSVIVSIGTTQTKVQLTAANALNKLAQTAGGSGYQELLIEVQPISATEAEARFFIDGKHVYKITFTYTGAAVMAAGIYVKSAGGATGETVKSDRLDAHQTR